MFFKSLTFYARESLLIYGNLIRCTCITMKFLIIFSFQISIPQKSGVIKFFKVLTEMNLFVAAREFARVAMTQSLSEPGRIGMP